MRNPIHKRLEHFATWQHLTFMACLCERMYPNYQLFCQVTEQSESAKIYRNVLNLVWESLTVKGAKINFENQLEKLENIIPDVNDYEFFGVVPALDACEALSELLHGIIAGCCTEHAVRVSQLSIQTIVTMLETQENRNFNEQDVKSAVEITNELDVQWQIYRTLNECEKRNIEVILELKNEIRTNGTSNIGIEV